MAERIGRMTSIATLAMINLDCGDPRVLADFYHQVLGWPITHSEDEFAMISDGRTGIGFGFGRVEGHRPQQWPAEDSPKRYHLDLYVDDLDDAEARCVKVGATKPDHQPGADRWRVLRDPEGHPFCLCVRS
jgi:predicted enzyme related to lactoylglutathione lyase